MLHLDRTNSVEEIYDFLKIYFKIELNKFRGPHDFYINISNIIHYTDYDGAYGVYDNGEFIKHDISNCDKKSPFWKALWKIEEDLSKQYKLNFYNIQFSFWYRGPIHFTKI